MRSILAVVTAVIVCCGDAFAVPPDPSPGIQVGRTAYDMQHNTSMGRQVARKPGADLVHLMWTYGDRIPSAVTGDGRTVGYNNLTVSSGVLNYGPSGTDICGQYLECWWVRPGYVDMEVDSGNAVHAVLHDRIEFGLPYMPWLHWYPIPGNSLNVADGLGGWDTASCNEVLWPRIAHTESGSANYDHIIAMENINNCSRGLVYYWRYDRNADLWQGPVVIDSTLGFESYVIEADPNSQKAAIILHAAHESQFNGQNNVAYYESQSAGTGWLDGSELGTANKRFITNYNALNQPAAGQNVSAVYDNDGALHVAWDEFIMDGFPDFTIQDDAIRHWSQTSGVIRTVVLSDWYLGVPYELPLDKLTIGIGDGSSTCNGASNRNSLYVVYTRFGGPTVPEMEDASAIGYHNGELYLNVSQDDGNSWSPPINLTNTKTPNCNPGPADVQTGQPPRPDSVCRSENWASINTFVHDIDILFVSDLDAGAIPQGEGTWQMNPVHYLRLPGGGVNQPYLCPLVGARIITQLALDTANACGVHASGGDSATATLTLTNYGTDTLDGSVSIVYTNPASPVTAWASIAGSQSMPFSIPNGAGDLNLNVVLDAVGLTGGSYQAELRVNHNAPEEHSPRVLPITFAVDPCRCIGDPICDGVTNVQDVIAVIDAAFRGVPEAPDSFCPIDPVAASGVTDVDCSGVTNIVDVVTTVSVAFRGAAASSVFCAPCAAPQAVSNSGLHHHLAHRLPVY